MGRISREARLCFILLWTVVDDSGRTRASSRMLASLLFPYDDDAAKKMPGWLKELSEENCIVLYEHERNSYLQVVNWGSHQKIDRPTPSKIPEPPTNPEPSTSSREASTSDRRSLAPEGKGKERKGSGEEEEGRGEPPAASLFPESWNELCGVLPKVGVFGASRQKKAATRIAEGISLSEFRRAVQICAKTPFLCGQNERGWRADYDWVMENDRNMDKILNGKYARAEGVTNGKPTATDKQQTNRAAIRVAIERVSAGLGDLDEPDDGRLSLGAGNHT